MSRYITVNGERVKCYCEPLRPDEPCRWHRNPIENLIRDTLGVGMYSGDELECKFIIGFELFNTRPYHNYETWSQGWNIQGHGIKVAHEFLLAAVKEWCRLFNIAKDGGELNVWNTYDYDSFRIGKRVQSETSLKYTFKKGT